MENIEELQSINVPVIEATTAGDISQIDQNITGDMMFQQVLIDSLAKKVCSVLPLSGPHGGLFNIRKKADSNDFELVRNDVNVLPTTIINTGITKEVIYDIKSIFGKDYDKIIGKMFRGIANKIENTDLLDFLQTNAKDDGALSLSSSLNAQINVFEVTQKVQEIVLKINSITYRSYEAFCILPATPLAGIMAMDKYVGGGDEDERGLFITRIGQTSYYLNPDPSDTYAYVGLRDSQNPSQSSITFSPYQSQIIEAVDPATGNTVNFLIDRFAITASPLHEVDNEMIYKFEITS